MLRVHIAVVQASGRPCSLQICEFAGGPCSDFANLPQLPWAADWRKLGLAARTGIDHMWPKLIRGHLP